MPKGEHPLSPLQRQCLLQWLKDQPFDANHCITPTNSEVSTLTASIKVKAGPLTKRFQAKAPASATAGVLRCHKIDCDLQITSLVAKWRTGLELRDKHMRRDVFHMDTFPQLHLTASGIPADLVRTGFSHKNFVVTITTAGRSSEHSAEVSCEPVAPTNAVKCSLDHLKWNLARQGLKVPSLFGLQVAPDVSVSGSLILDVEW